MLKLKTDYFIHLVLSFIVISILVLAIKFATQFYLLTQNYGPYALFVLMALFVFLFARLEKKPLGKEDALGLSISLFIISLVVNAATLIINGIISYGLPLNYFLGSLIVSVINCILFYAVFFAICEITNLNASRK